MTNATSKRDERAGAQRTEETRARRCASETQRRAA